MREKTNWKRLLRRYAGETGAGGVGTGSEGNTDNTGTTDSDTGSKETPKTFTQEEVNALMAKEKKQGKLTVLKELGLEDSKATKEEIAAYKKWLDDQKTDLQKANDTVTAEKTAKELLAKENDALKFKIEAISLGVKPDCVDAVAAIVAISMTEGSDSKEVLKGLKTKPEYKGFFADGYGSAAGTGSSIGGKTGSSGTESLGQRLGKSSATEAKKSSYFSN